MLAATWNWTFSVCIHYHPPIPQELYTNIQLYWWKTWQGAFGKDFSFRTDFPARRFWGSCSIAHMAPTLLQTISVAKKASWSHHFFSFSYRLIKASSGGKKVGLFVSATLNILIQPPVPIRIDLLAKLIKDLMWAGMAQNGDFWLFLFWIFNISAGEVGSLYSKHKLSKALISSAVSHRLLHRKTLS